MDLAASSELRFGLGFDSHPADPDRLLHLGGVLFPGEPGLAGHSDADVLCHALGDALLGASGLGDLGAHFPDDDERYAGLAGLDLLGRVVDLAAAEGWRPHSCDLTLVAERPRLAERREEVQLNIARTMDVEVERVSVKATRPEGLGLTGDGAACLALAVVAKG